MLFRSFLPDLPTVRCLRKINLLLGSYLQPQGTMASLEDYDEFGNYIGADLDSDDEEDMQQTGYGREASEPTAQPLEGFEDEPMAGVEEGALMQIDGTCLDIRAYGIRMGHEINSWR